LKRMHLAKKYTLWANTPSPSPEPEAAPARAAQRGEEKRRSASGSDSEEEAKRKREKKAKKEKKEKKSKKKRKRSRSRSPSASVSEEAAPAPATMADELEEEEAQKFREFMQAQRQAAAAAAAVVVPEEEERPIGPEPPPPEGMMAHGKLNYGGAMRPGEGDAIAQFVQAGKRIPRRGEVGLEADEIERYENLGYVMSGSRHARMNAIRMRKENQVYSAEEKAALAMLNHEERAQREDKVMSDLRKLVDKHLGGAKGDAQ